MLIHNTSSVKVSVISIAFKTVVYEVSQRGVTVFSQNF